MSEFVSDRGLSPARVKEKVHELISIAGLEPRGLLRALRETDSIISGSTAALVLTDASFLPNDLDVYVAEQHEATMLHVLQHSQYFALDRSQSNSYSSNVAILRVHWLTKGDCIVNLIVVEGANATRAIFFFHSTFVMNFIAWHGVYCAYPDLTLLRLGLIHSGLPLDTYSAVRANLAIAKYEARGVAFRCALRHFSPWRDHACGDHAMCASTPRTLHDHAGLFVPFDPLFASELIFDGFPSLSWRLGGPSCDNDDVFPLVSAEVCFLFGLFVLFTAY